MTVPTIGLTSSPLNDNYLVIIVNPHISFSINHKTQPIPPISNPINKVDPDSSKPNVLHWFQTNLTLSPSNISIASLSFHPLLSTTPPLASYIKPKPPAGSGPHRYTELLYSQPADFSIPVNYARFFGPDSTRTSFNLSSFVRDAGLGKPVAANYFLAENSTVRGNQTAGTGTSSTSATGTGGNVQGELFPSLIRRYHGRAWFLSVREAEFEKG